jgi:feruloyl esterase
MRQPVLPAMLACMGLVACDGEPARELESATQPLPCEEIVSLQVDDTDIASAETVAAGAFEQPPANFPQFPADYSKLPAFCRVTGSIHPSPDSDIRFELWLPADGWNGRFLQTGNGGAAGSIFYFAMPEPLSRGYAVANTDTGHRGGGGDFSWAAGHPEKLTDYQYRAVQELTRVGKAITEARYGRPPELSYFVGCSTGGRQGLKEAQRYPGDYDAIIAGAPANNWSPLMSLTLLIERNLGPHGLDIGKLGLLKEAAIAACDARDGVTDRVIAEPGKCDFDPASTQCQGELTDQCLSSQDVAAAQRIYAGVVSESGDVLMPGTGPGSEPGWAFFASPNFRIGSSFYRHVVMNDPGWNPATIDAHDALSLAEKVDGGAFSAMDPDLSGYIERGGKLLIYHGTTDGLIPYGSTVNYYESVVGRFGEDATSDSVRLYLVPGMDHCAGGEGAYAIDWLTAMETWTERGKTPQALPAVHPAVMPGLADAPRGSPFTRPVCPYPQLARYTGSGDETDAANYQCGIP